MAKVQSPLLSGGVSGQVGKSLVFGRWRGVRYARSYVVPANPRTSAQQSVRGTFSFLNSLWAFLVDTRQVWEAYSRGRAFTARNAWIKENLPGLRGAADLSGLVLSPGVAGGYSLASFAATGGAGSISASATVADLPTGWVVDGIAFVVVPDQEPVGMFAGTVTEQLDNAEPYELSLTGVSAGSYFVGAYAVYTKPTGEKAYSASLGTIVTVT